MCLLDIDTYNDSTQLRRDLMRSAVKDFSRNQMKYISEAYAESGLEMSGSYFCETYEVTPSVFYAILKKSIIESVVSEEIGWKIAKKSAENTRLHGGTGAYSTTMRTYERYFDLRKEFEFPKSKRIQYAKEYAESPLPFNLYAKQNCISRKLLERTLNSAIVDNLIDDDTVRKLEAKAKSNNKSEFSFSFWERLWSSREKNKQWQKRTVKKKSNRKQEPAAPCDRVKRKLQNAKEMQRIFCEAEKEYYGIPDEMSEYEESIAKKSDED